MTTALFFDEIETPLGPLGIVVDLDGRLLAAGFTSGHARPSRWLQSGRTAARRAADPAGVATALAAYFAGEHAALDGLATHAEGTEFQLRVWDALRQIPCGATWTYGELAARVGNPAAVRAVGSANGANPIAVVVPCHRVIGAGGALTGYAAGLERKRWLLAHERRTSQPPRAEALRSTP